MVINSINIGAAKATDDTSSYAGAASSSHGLLVPCARSAAGRPAAVAATAAPHLAARSGLTRGNADSAATTPRSNTPLFLAA